MLNKQRTTENSNRRCGLQAGDDVAADALDLLQHRTALHEDEIEPDVRVLLQSVHDVIRRADEIRAQAAVGDGVVLEVESESSSELLMNTS